MRLLLFASRILYFINGATYKSFPLFFRQLLLLLVSELIHIMFVLVPHIKHLLVDLFALQD